MVTYHPDKAILLSALSALLSQVSVVIVVDNGSGISIKETIKCLESKWPKGIKLLSLTHNHGLGEAYNIGISTARDMKARFVLLMDQDSIPEPTMVEELQTAYIDLADQGKQIAAVGACYRNTATAAVSRFVRVTQFGLTRVGCDATTNVVRADFLISSGSLISLETLNCVGDMDRDLFIDHIDTEWCFRAESKGYKSYGVCSATMRHSLGERQTRFWWGRWRTISFHQPFRYYYMFRNSVLLWYRPYMPARWKRADGLRLLYFLFFFSILSSNRIANLRMMLKGLIDGFKKRTGKL